MPQPGPGEVLVKTTLLSLDPASRAWMAGRTYRAQLEPGEIMAGWGLGEVVKSTRRNSRPAISSAASSAGRNSSRCRRGS